MKRFVIGDIHGAYKALAQCLERSEFDKEKDMLISLGDLCDGWEDVEKVFEEMLSIRNLILILGNHDNWLLDWYRNGKEPSIWLMQGGELTLKSLQRKVNSDYHSLLENAKLYYQLDNNLFVHAGLNPDFPPEIQKKETLIWDRSLVEIAVYMQNVGNQKSLTTYDMVYIGHTPTLILQETLPLTFNGICMMDTGAGYPDGKLSILDFENREIYQSDKIKQLYSYGGR